MMQFKFCNQKFIIALEHFVPFFTGLERNLKLSDPTKLDKMLKMSL